MHWSSERAAVSHISATQTFLFNEICQFKQTMHFDFSSDVTFGNSNDNQSVLRQWCIWDVKQVYFLRYGLTSGWMAIVSVAVRGQTSNTVAQ